MEKTEEEWEKVKNEFKEWYIDNSNVFKLAKDMYQSLITSLLFDRDEISNPTIESRIKDRSSCISKFERKYLNEYKSGISLTDVKDRLTDLIGIRIICSYEDEIEKVEKIITNNFLIIDKTDKSKNLRETNTFGYNGLHFDVKMSDTRKNLDEYKKIADFPIEIQIRTIIQHAWSSLDHKVIYKKATPIELTRAVDRLAALFEIADSEFIRLRDETKELEKKSEEKIKTSENLESEKKLENEADSKIDYITFNKFLNMKFNARFYFPTTSSLLDEIFRNKDDFNLFTLTQAYEEKNPLVENYKQENSKILSMNPLTQLRHILYGYDRDTYSRLLTDFQRTRFDEYLKNR